MDLYGIKEDAMDVAKIGASALVGAAVAKQVVKMVPDFGGSQYVKPLIPVAVGVAVHTYGKMNFPVAAPGVAAGMMAFGIAALVKAILPDAQKATVGEYLPFNGLGETYDTGLMGLGYSYGAGVDAYMHGAPTQVQTLMGAPTQVQSISGLGSTIVGGSAPLSASLM